jgi:hypothetical protein
MIPKIKKSDNLYGTLTYNLQKVGEGVARVLGVNEMWESAAGDYRLADFTAAFNARLAVNRRTKKTIAHISLNPSPEDAMTNGQMLAYARDYMERMGFGGQPYVVFKHEDIERHHVHIVATYVKADGSRVGNENDFAESLKVVKDLDAKYGLHPVRKGEGERYELAKVSPEKGKIGYQIKNIAEHLLGSYRFSTVNELKAALLLYNVDMQEVRGATGSGQAYTGVVYSATDDAGKRVATPIKSSRLGKEYGLPAVEQKIEKAAKALESLDKSGIRQALKSCMAQATGKGELLQRLKEKGVDIAFRVNDAGRAYGVTVIDHNAKVIMNGSRLGKEFSANAFHALFERWAAGMPAPEEAAKSPAKAMGSPAKGTGSPAKAAGSPAEAAGSPAKGTGSPAEAAGSPAKEKEPGWSGGEGAGSAGDFALEAGEDRGGDNGSIGSAEVGSAEEAGLAFAEVLAGLFGAPVAPHREKRFAPGRDDDDDDDDDDKKGRRKKRARRRSS